jgi:hypothetical protein
MGRASPPVKAAASAQHATSYEPVAWHVCGATWVAENVWDKRIPVDIVKRFRPVPAGTCAASPCTLAKPGRIVDTSHPACGQCGLFAAKKLVFGTHVCDYRGVVTLTDHESKTSDYTLSFVEEPGVRLTLDAERFGNEARFINDFRGTGRKANVAFQSRVDGRGVSHMAVVVTAPDGIPKGQELLLSYGKHFWLARGLLHRSNDVDNGEADEDVSQLTGALGDGLHLTAVAQ